jgi:hypothetical protein
MFGLRPQEAILIVVMFTVVVAVAIGIIYSAVRLAIRHERKEQK